MCFSANKESSILNLVQTKSVQTKHTMVELITEWD